MNKGVQLNALDPRSLADLQRLAREDGRSDEALRAAAQQFEALFLTMMLKSMRASTMNNDLIDSEQTRMYQSMHDDQLALDLAQGRGMGLADALFRQLGGGREATPPGEELLAALKRLPQAGAKTPAFDLAGVPRQGRAAPSRQVDEPGLPPAAAAAGAAAMAGADLLGGQANTPLRLFSDGSDAGKVLIDLALQAERLRDTTGATSGALSASEQRAQDFVRQMWPHAQAASARTGIPPAFMIAQAALETGWGEKQLRHGDGSPSHNLFNIKAGSQWQGDTVARTVTEYAGAQAYQEEARFRAYDSYAASFRDYARLIMDSPRYAQVRGQTEGSGFARSLQAAGYATDPAYADKLSRIISGKTLRTALAGLG